LKPKRRLKTLVGSQKIEALRLAAECVMPAKALEFVFDKGRAPVPCSDACSAAAHRLWKHGGGMLIPQSVKLPLPSTATARKVPGSPVYGPRMTDHLPNPLFVAGIV
jgi:hypothetical protein